MGLQSASAWIAPLQTYTTGLPLGAGSAWLGGNDSTYHGRGRTIRQ
jgi:hypothetical protein